MYDHFTSIYINDYITAITATVTTPTYTIVLTINTNYFSYNASYDYYSYIRRQLQWDTNWLWIRGTFGTWNMETLWDVGYRDVLERGILGRFRT